MSPVYRIERDSKFLFDGLMLTYKRHIHGKKRPYVFEDEDGYPHTLSFRDIRNARHDSTLRNWERPSTAIVRCGEVVHRARVTIASARKTERDDVERYMAYINAWLAKPGTPRSARGLQPLIDAVYAQRRMEADNARRFEPPPFSVSRFQQLIRAYVNGGCHADALVPQTRLRGNHRQRLNQTVMDIVYHKTDELYLTLHGTTAAGLHQAVKEAVKYRNSQHLPEMALLPPSYEAIKRFVDGLCRYTVLFCREGKQVANNEFRMIGGGIVTERANEVWEIDDTRVDLICRSADGRTVIGRPWMIIVIDRHTRIIMSFVLTFSPPDTRSALEAVRLAIHNKDWVSKANLGLRTGWPAEGRPEAIHVDNGKQYNSAAFKAAVTFLGIQHFTLPVLKAWWKGTVERLIGTVMRQVFHVEPGTTFANIFERNDETPPEQVAVVTLAEAQAKLLSWVVNDYQHRHHRGIEATPFAMWNASIEQHPVLMPHTTQQVDAVLSITDSGHIKNGGIVLDGLRYLTAHGLRMEMSPRFASKDEVIVRRDPGNLTAIQFLDAGVADIARGDWHVAEICSAHRRRAEGQTLEEYRLGNALRAKNPDLVERDPEWNETRQLVKDMREDAAASPRLTDRRRAEGERERVLKQSKHRVERERNTAAGIAEGGDLQARLEAMDSPASPIDMPPAADQDADQALDALRKGRPRSRTRTRRED